MQRTNEFREPGADTSPGAAEPGQVRAFPGSWELSATPGTPAFLAFHGVHNILFAMRWKRTSKQLISVSVPEVSNPLSHGSSRI